MSPSTPNTPPPIHAKLTPQSERFASMPSPSVCPASPPKLTPANGTRRPSARAAAGVNAMSSNPIASVRRKNITSPFYCCRRLVEAHARACGYGSCRQESRHSSGTDGLLPLSAPRSTAELRPQPTLTSSSSGIKRHLSNIFDKLGVFSRLELAIFALNHGLVEDRDAMG